MQSKKKVPSSRTRKPQRKWNSHTRAIPSSNPGHLSDAEGVIKGFRSQFEQRIAEDLVSRGIKFRYEREQDKLTWIKPATHHVYTPDYVLLLPGDRKIYVEAKGRLTGDDMSKMIFVSQQHADLDIRWLFSNARTSAGRQKKTAGEWASKHGFTWAEKVVPDSWLK